MKRIADANGGVGYRFTPWFTLMSEFDFAGLGIPDSVLAEAQAPDGHGHIFSLNFEPQFYGDYFADVGTISC